MPLLKRTQAHTYAYNLVKLVSNSRLLILAGQSPDARLVLLLCIFWHQSTELHL